MSNLRLRLQLFLLAFAVIAGAAVFGARTVLMVSAVKVGGEHYATIVQNKDLIADVLPPPNYIVESYLTALLLADPERAAEQDKNIARLSQLRREYNERYYFWSKEKLPPELRNAFLTRAHEPAVQFYRIAETDFLPAIRSGNTTAMRNALAQMTALYETHRKAIDEVVRLTTAHLAAEENSAADELSRDFIFLVTVYVVTFLLAAGIAIAFALSLARGIERARMAVLRLADGDFQLPPATRRRDELGDLLRAVGEAALRLRATATDTHGGAAQPARAVGQLPVTADAITNNTVGDRAVGAPAPSVSCSD